MSAETVGAKFDLYTAGRLDRAARSKVKDFVLDLESADSIRPLMDLLRG